MCKGEKMTHNLIFSNYEEIHLSESSRFISQAHMFFPCFNSKENWNEPSWQKFMSLFSLKSELAVIGCVLRLIECTLDSLLWIQLLNRMS